MATSKSISYRALRIRQTDSGGWLVLFAAPSTEIIEWAGIPQKKEIGGGNNDRQETTGFQREEDKKRINDLIDFYSNESNVIQNPLLCATRHTEQGIVEFQPDSLDESIPFAETGKLVISSETLEELSLLELLRRVKSDLEKRVPRLKHETPSDKLVSDLKRRASDTFQGYLDIEEEDSDSDSEMSDDSPTGVIFTDESHIYDFWEEVAARVQVLQELSTSFDRDEFLGYSKDAMLSFLRPIVVVDGQHRLRGAVRSAKFRVSQPPYSNKLTDLVLSGEDPDTAQRKIENEVARRLPISLLMTDDPAEHVFQFVVVNQKATPIGKALLGTIVSTSLSNEELERVSERLEKSGIQLENSRAVAYFTRNPHSPFYKKVERGLTSENSDLLKWSVLLSLVKIFQELKGGRLYGEKIDWADKWKRKFILLSNNKNGGDSDSLCGIVDDWERKGFKDPFAYWSHFEGPWREVFNSFWCCVRDKLADSSDESANNYWGLPTTSNIFNKVSLTILSADFFQYLCERNQPIDSVNDVPQIVNDWLTDVNSSYFSRAWNLKRGIQKDTPAVQEKWAKLWSDYRKDPLQLPKVSSYNP
jgi:hypothetical protein